MKAFASLAGFAVLAAASAGNAAKSEVTPVQKVVQLLEDMSAKGKQEKHEEQVLFATYKQFCDDTSAEKKASIAEADERIAVLKADIEKASADASRLAKEIRKHEEDIDAWTGDTKAATTVRNFEKEDYSAIHKDYSESIDALQRAIPLLKKQVRDLPQTSFAQVSSLRTLDLIPENAKAAIAAFLAEDDEPQAYGYESKSQDIVQMLEQLLDKFIAERTSLEKEESSAQHAYQLLVADLAAQIDSATRSRDSKSTTRQAKLQSKAAAEGELNDTTASRNSDQDYLNELTATCNQKATDFESRQQLRAEELEAIAKAIEIISSGAVAGNSKKHLPQLLQAKHSALVHLRADLYRADQERAAKLLAARATELGSRALALLASRVAADPFVKVRKMIQDLITKLMEEANAEAEHKGWCDTELATNAQTRTEKTDLVNTLRAEIDELTASAAKLSQEIAALSSALAELDAAVAQSTKIREEEKAKNAQTVKDASEAQAAVAQALTVLKEFYSKAAQATALVQQSQAPPIFDSPYRGMGAENGGVIGMLEVIQSDFARLESDTKSAEATAQKEYERFMAESETDKAQKTTDMKHKNSRKEENERAAGAKSVDLEGTQKELVAANAYFDKLKPSCIDEGEDYAERAARRKAEIASLRDALAVLNGQ